MHNSRASHHQMQLSAAACLLQARKGRRDGDLAGFWGDWVYSLPLPKAGTYRGPGWHLGGNCPWCLFCKKASISQASVSDQLSPCEPSTLPAFWVLFLASQVLVTRSAHAHLSPSPGILSLLNWSHWSPSGFPARLRQVVTHVLGRLISVPFPCTLHSGVLCYSKAGADHPVPWQGKKQHLSPG